MLGEGVDYDERGGVRRLIEVEHHVLAGLNRPTVVVPAYLWLWCPGNTCMKSGHGPVWHGAARDWLDKNGLLAHRGFL